MNSTVDEINKERNCASLRWASDDCLHNSIIFNIAKLKLIEVRECYGLIAFSIHSFCVFYRDLELLGASILSL